MGDVAAILEPADSGAEVGDLTFDVTNSEAHSASASTTSSPVEEGATFADHTTQDPDTLSLECLWSDTPPDANRANIGRAIRLHQRLKALKESGEPVEVVTGLEVYEDMVIQSIDTRRDASTGSAIPESVTLKQIRIGQRETGFVPPESQSQEVAHSAQEQKERGRQASEPADPKTAKKTERKSSALYDVLFSE